MDVRTRRRQQVRETMADIRRIVGDAAPGRETLRQVSARLQQLADQEELFPTADFPAPARDSGTTSARYLLHAEPDDSFALYANIINPGKTTKPHNHGTWAVIVSVGGEELNRIYRRLDDGSDPGHADIEQVREYVVKPGSPIEFMPDDIHSIHVSGDDTVRHFHLYGKALETLSGRLGFDPQTGRVYDYNKTFMRPTVGRDV